MESSNLLETNKDDAAAGGASDIAINSIRYRHDAHQSILFNKIREQNAPPLGIYRHLPVAKNICHFYDK